MKMICPHHKLCPSTSCYHRKPHLANAGCKTKCFPENLEDDGKYDIKCVPYLKEERKEKLNKLNSI
jgi:hypothetical protein